MDNILGVYARFERKADDDAKVAEERSAAFREYLWGRDGSGGLAARLKLLKRHYGDDLNLILFQFRVVVGDEPMNEDATLENYRSKEKSIGIWIPITNENFFSKGDTEKDKFVAKQILDGLAKVKARLESKKLDVDIQRLKVDTESLLVV